ncbi:MAG: ATP-binding protein [Acidobacteriota bacterium]
MIRTLYGKLAAVFLVLLVLAGTAGAAASATAVSLYLNEVSQRLNRDLAAHLIADSELVEDGQLREAGLKHIFHMLMVINPRIEVYLLDPQGEILAFDAPHGQVLKPRVDLRPVQTLMTGDEPLPILGDDPRSMDRRKVFSVAPVLDDQGSRLGFLYVVLGGQRYDSVADMMRDSYILRLGLWGAFGALLATVAAGLLVFRLLTRRLRRLDCRMRRFADQELKTKAAFTESGGDEVDRLDSTFHQMAELIARQMKDLETADRTRRELVVGVSHDLRTPLASMRGYLETLLLKEASLSASARREYLQIALDQSERLARLVDELFELSRLEAGETRLEREPFSLPELVQDVVQKVQIEAAKGQIEITSELPWDLPFVDGDLRLIERVLENLLHNALRYTPAGGKIHVALDEGEGRIAVRVADTGQGIPQDDLPKIFDQFYRGSNNRTGSRDGTGLGLAIAKRILDLHGGPIGVESQTGRGSTFRFELPAAS